MLFYSHWSPKLKSATRSHCRLRHASEIDICRNLAWGFNSYLQGAEGADFVVGLQRLFQYTLRATRWCSPCYLSTGTESIVCRSEIYRCIEKGPVPYLYIPMQVSGLSQLQYRSRAAGIPEFESVYFQLLKRLRTLDALSQGRGFSHNTAELV